MKCSYYKKTPLVWLIVVVATLSFTTWAWSAVTVAWTKKYSIVGDNDFKKVASNSSGNIYIVGNVPGDSEDDQDILVRKYSRSGRLLLNKTIDVNNGSYDQGEAIAVDEDGNIYLAGSTKAAGSSDAAVWVGKCNSSGTLVWQGTGTSGAAYDIAVKGSRVVVGGALGDNGFVVIYDQDGSEQWLREITNTGYAIVNGVAFSSRNNVYVAATTNKTTDTDNRHGLIRRYTAGGKLVWQKRDLGKDAIDIGVAGSRFYAVGTGPNGAWIRRYTTGGALVWFRIYSNGSDRSVIPADLAIDSKNNVYTTGRVSPNKGSIRMFAIKYSPSGNNNWATRKLYGIESQGNGIIVSHKHPYISGAYKTDAKGWNGWLRKYNQ